MSRLSKNNFMRGMLSLLSGLILLGTVACNNGGGGGGSSSTPATPITNGTNGYSIVNGQCVYTATNQISSPQYCNLGTQTTSFANYPVGYYPTTGISTGLCYGVYYYAVYGYFQPVACLGTPDNCAGYTLINSFGQYQYCY